MTEKFNDQHVFSSTDRVKAHKLFDTAPEKIQDVGENLKEALLKGAGERGR